MHYRLLYPTEYLCHADLAGKDCELTIKEMNQEELVMEGGRKEMAWVITFEKAKKRFVVNKTNSKLIAHATGEDDTENWIGKNITLYPTKTKFGRDTVDCIRVRADVKKGGMA